MLPETKTTRTAKSLAKTKIERAKWKVIAAPVISNAIRNFVHFSNKVTNSNTLAGGVRIANTQQLDLPVVAVQTLGANNVPLDYVSNAQQAATVARQLEAVADGTVDVLFFDVPPENLALYQQEYAAARNQAAEVRQDGIAKRLRQIILQDADGKDVALTPLGCAGLGLLLSQRLKQEREEQPEKDRVFRRRGFLELGGANPQNVGRHIRSLQRPLWFTAPTENPKLRAAYAVHYNGISLAPPAQLLLEYDTWLLAEKSKGEGEIKNDLYRREREDEFISSIAKAVASRAQNAFAAGASVKASLPDEEITSSSLAQDMRALIDPELKYSGWKREIARKIFLAILEQKMYFPDGARTLGIGQDAAARWIGIIEEAL
jgi:hypothetical protein